MSRASTLLNKMVKDKNPPKAKEKKSERPIKVVPELSNWIAASVGFEIMEARKGVEAGPICEKLVDEFAEQLYNQGFQPVNPRVVVKNGDEIDHQANFTVQGRFKISAETSDELRNNLRTILGSDKLFDNEIDCTPYTGLRPFNELVFGHYVGKDFVPATAQEEAIATKLLTFVQGGKSTPLTEVEREMVLIHEDQMKVKPGFFDRVAGYCADLKQLKAVFRVIIPVHFLSHAKFGVGDTPTLRLSRLKDEVSEILGEVDELAEAA